MIEARLHLQRPGFELSLDAHLPATGVTALFGPSGCGKTTVLRAIAGLERAAGRVVVAGEVWQDDSTGRWVPPHRRALGYVIQEAALFPHLDVNQNLQYGLRRVPAAQRQVPLDQVVELLGIGHLMQRRTTTLSGGERQRVAIARALATSPRLLLMDEPLAALDAARKAEVLPYLDRLQASLRIPVLYVSHSLEEVARLADHLVLMAAGKALAIGPLSDVLSRVDLPQAFGDEAGVVLQARVTERDPSWQLVRLALQGSACTLWARDQGHALQQPVRLRLLARDVGLAISPQSGSSIGNQLPGTVVVMAPDQHPALMLVKVQLQAQAGPPGGADDQPPAVLARLTRRSVQELGLQVGTSVWVLVKMVALMEAVAGSAR